LRRFRFWILAKAWSRKPSAISDTMTILGIVALIVLVILGVMVLRVKSDPGENESLQKLLSRSKRDDNAPPT
jgi:hypothetical protein